MSKLVFSHEVVDAVETLCRLFGDKEFTTLLDYARTGMSECQGEDFEMLSGAVETLEAVGIM